MELQIDLGDLKSWKSSRMMGMALKSLLDSLTTINLQILTTHHIPPLYSCGVRYQNEPREWVREHFDAIPVVLGRGWGDCDDLAPWRCAELRKAGKRAAIRVKWKKYPQGKLYHIVVAVRHTISDPATGAVRTFVEEEDPSARLGMPT